MHPAQSWRVLARCPRVWLSSEPILASTVCAQIVDAARSRMTASTRAEAYIGMVDYRSIGLHSAGPELQQIVLASGAVEAATAATGVEYRAGEDIMIARTIACTAAPAHCTSLINMHHDRHKNPYRQATFMIYLTTVARGGETFFPCAGNKKHKKQGEEGDEIEIALEQEYRSGTRSLRHDAPIVAQCNERLREWRAGSHDCGGVGAAASVGTALVFDAKPVAAAWHAPCAVSGNEEKWTLTFFKTPPQLMSFGTLMGP